MPPIPDSLDSQTAPMTPNFEFELLAQRFLIGNGATFIAPRFEIPYHKDTHEGGSNPDLIAIRPRHRECYVVEVSVSGRPRDLLERVNQRDSLWYSPLRKRLSESGIIDESWQVELLVFMRADQIQKFRRSLNTQDGVHVWPLEFIMQHWLWPEQVRQPDFDLRDTALAYDRSSQLFSLQS